MYRRPTNEFLIALGIIAGLVSLVYVILSAAATSHASETPRVESPSRPAICAKYYNDGTHRWKDCMGVGLK